MSTANEKAMQDADRHATGDDRSHAKDEGAKIHGHEHTKPAGDLREVELKEDRAKRERGQTNRGH